MNCFKFLPLLLLVWACDDSVAPQHTSREISTAESSLIGKWEYESINVDGIDYFFATQANEPRISEAFAGGARSEIRRRSIEYFEDKTYAIGWTYWGNYWLGTDGDPNWQPSFGNWTIQNGLLVHNPGMEHEVSYELSTQNQELIRSHERYMSEDNYYWDASILWRRGDIVFFSEVFRRSN